MKGKWRSRKERHTKESVTFISSKPLLGRGDIRGTLSHQSNTLRGAKAHLFYRLGILNILWWEKGGWSRWALGKMAGKEDADAVGAGLSREGHWGWAGMHVFSTFQEFQHLHYFSVSQRSNRCHICRFSFYFLCLFFFFRGTGVWTQGFELAKQTSTLLLEPHLILFFWEKVLQCIPESCSSFLNLQCWD
jgi:hypothetical protein